MSWGDSYVYFFTNILRIERRTNEVQRQIKETKDRPANDAFARLVLEVSSSRTTLNEDAIIKNTNGIVEVPLPPFIPRYKKIVESFA